MTVGEPLDPANATGRKNQGKWGALTRRVAYRIGLTAIDPIGDLADDAKIPPIDLKASRLGPNNEIAAFIRLLGGASTVTIELFVNVLDVVKGSTPAGDETDFALIESVTVTVNTMFKFSGGAGGAGIPPGTYKLRISAITAGGGSVEIHEQHTLG